MHAQPAQENQETRVQKYKNMHCEILEGGNFNLPYDDELKPFKDVQIKVAFTVDGHYPQAAVSWIAIQLNQ